MRWFVLLMTISGFGYLIYMASFYAWVSATPIQQPELAQALAVRYFFGSFALLIGGGCVFAYLSLKRANAKRKGRQATNKGHV